MNNKIFKTLKRWRDEKREYIALKKRAKDLPKEYQIVYKEIEAYMWTFALGADMMIVFGDVLDMFEAGASANKDILSIVGEDVGDFCDGLLKEIQTQTWTGKRKKMMNQKIHRKLGK